MKYIDAERLKCELEKRLKNVRDYMNGAGMKYKGPKYYKAQGKESAYDALLSVIDSLQQEQPEAFDTVAFKKGVNEGKRLMMEGAVEGVVCILPGYVAYVKEKNNESLKQYLLDNFKAGDEVRIIILQKEGEDD